ncbi:quinoprotein dehydrogenase-associated ABC transporter substrate-binding protein [Gemmatirosa kalamazoonensis]|uniref:Quinoprotein dehydrogenase-associated ABC transporter substrate-binding protein n=1 Tax=Gemmatirosa kalamazoonensis TaxID=861299 RepID=W0RFB9_9BACT|nr:quinoprotein dehydrogenase-associated putative ABC transporter substrate-binding protein [Gemmatirosa kalamazoonensis]AHG89491.1 quinoprotein dehydrogenase-associated ABC transporter substrate-binding protein [Gemmatirosa kalamazoonensis]
MVTHPSPTRRRRRLVAVLTVAAALVVAAVLVARGRGAAAAAPTASAADGGAALSPRDAAQAPSGLAPAVWVAGTPGARVLRACADPNNLPFSDSTGAGFENHIAELLATELHARLEYTWWAQRRGYVRNTLAAGACDVLLGIPASFDRALRTRPYYRSTYVFVTQRGGPHVRSFDDPVLKRLRIGVSVVGDDYAATPPVHALLARDVPPDHLRGYTVYGDYREPAPPARVVDAVARGDVDVAIAWGPLAGYFAARAPRPLAVTPVSPQIDLPFLPFVFDIAMGVRRGDTALRDSLDAILVRRKPTIDSLLASYHVPRLDVAGP